MKRCTSCLEEGRSARNCGVEAVLLHVYVRIPKDMLTAIDTFAATMERPLRARAITRLLIEGLVAMDGRKP